MNLIAFSSDHLQQGKPLPFGVRDRGGRLLLAAGQAIDGAEQMKFLRAQPLFADEEESNEWRRRLATVMDQMLRQNATLKTIVDARPKELDKDNGTQLEASVADQWESAAVLLDAIYREAEPSPEWVARVLALHERVSALGQRYADESLYHLIHGAGHFLDKYSCHHALLAMLVCELAAGLLEWDSPRSQAVGRAALTMNVTMAELQNLLAHSSSAPTPEMRRHIDAHAHTAAQLLHDAGVSDPLWCQAVRLHHERTGDGVELSSLPPEQQVARLLRRVDMFTAKISRRRSREPMSPVQAAREACLGPDGKPDQVGAALLRATGMYPPGCYVELANGERGIVIARGQRANMPRVASLVGASGMALGEPALRDTVETRFAVRSAVPSAQIKVRPDHQRVLALR